MRSKRCRLPDFEACSLVLFTLLAAGASLPSRAQNAFNATTGSGFTRAGALSTRSQATRHPPRSLANPWTRERIGEAFRRTDLDCDGAISASEADGVAPLARRFARIDANHDGTISGSEFFDALK